MANQYLTPFACFVLIVNLHFLLTLAAEPPLNTMKSAKYLHDMKVPFFSTVSLHCDHPLLNVSLSSEVVAISWVFPDGTNIYSQNDVDADLYSFSSGTTSNGKVLELYNLTALEIDEAQFGHYFCVVQYTSSRVAVIRWGLNVNGADFSELLDEYRENAIVGGIAAAALLLVVGGICLFWNVRNSKKIEDDDDDERRDPKTGMPVVSTRDENERKFRNAAYKEDVDDEATVDVHM